MSRFYIPENLPEDLQNQCVALQILRDYFDLTKTHLARKLGVDSVLITELEAGKRNILAEDEIGWRYIELFNLSGIFHFLLENGKRFESDKTLLQDIEKLFQEKFFDERDKNKKDFLMRLVIRNLEINRVKNIKCVL